MIGVDAIAAEQAAALLADDVALSEFEAGLLEVPPAVAAHLDERLRRLRGYGREADDG